MCHSRVLVIDLCDTVAQVTKAVEEMYGPRPDPLFRFHPAVPVDFWADPGNRIAREIFKFAEPFPGAAKGVNMLAQRFQIVYLTARPEWSKPVSKRWLRQNGFPEAPIICTQDKYSWILKHGAIGAVEDMPEHIQIISTLIPVYVPSQEWKGLGYQFRWEELHDGSKQCCSF